MEWKTFKLNDIFKIYKSENIVATDLTAGTVPYVSRSVFNNGIVKYVDPKNYHLNPANTITIGGESAKAFIQTTQYLTGNNITILQNPHLNLWNGLFIVSILNLETAKYSYGRAWNLNKIQATRIALPVNEQGTIDYEYMEQYMKKLFNQELKNQIAKRQELLI